MGLMSVSFAEPQPSRDLVAEVEYWSRHVCAVWLVDELSVVLGVPDDLVWQALSTVPLNMAPLLDSPQGWNVLGGYVAVELGVGPVDFLPAVH